MALATYKDLVIDASDAQRSGAFWAGALGLRLEENGPADVVLRGRTPAHTVWIDQVPEPKTVKNRVHLDVHTGDIGALTALGATILNDTDFPWIVMADPEGQEFCAFVREQPPDDLLYEIVVDCADPEAIAAWWGHVFGVKVDRHDDDLGAYFSLGGLPGTSFDGMTFGPVPEPKTAKNRVHWDVRGSVPALLEAGARMVRPATEDPEPDRDWDGPEILPADEPDDKLDDELDEATVLEDTTADDDTSQTSQTLPVLWKPVLALPPAGQSCATRSPCVVRNHSLTDSVQKTYG